MGLRPTQENENRSVFDRGLCAAVATETRPVTDVPGSPSCITRTLATSEAEPQAGACGPAPSRAMPDPEPRTPVSAHGPNGPPQGMKAGWFSTERSWPNTIAKAPPLPNNPSPHIPTKFGCSFRKPCSPAQTSSGNAAISSTSGTAAGSFAMFTWCRYFRHDSQTCTCRCSSSGAA